MTPIQETGLKPEGKEKFFAEKEVNGIKIICTWYDHYDDYSLYFPQIKMNSKQAQELNIPDQVIRISKDQDKAKEAFEKAVQEAENATDVYDLYKKMWAR